MCGIWGYVSKSQIGSDLIPKLFSSFMKVQPRGPDRSEFKQINEFMEIFIGFHRLAIMDKSTYGDQPFTLEVKDLSKKIHKSIYAICNGEIYNYKQLSQQNDFKLKSGSDCEFLPQMYNKFGFVEMLKQLRGEFAICILDVDHTKDNIKLFLGRDQTAVRPIYIGMDKNGIAFSSIMAGIVKIVDNKSIRQVDRAEYISIDITKNNDPIINSGVYHTLDLVKIDQKTNLNTVLKLVRDSLIDAVECRMESDRPIGALLSGGLDSSLVVSIASNYLKKHNKKLSTFSIGIPGSTDKYYAELVAKHCDTDHTHVEFTQQDFLNALPKIVEVTETCDITTIRASTGQYLISKWINENTDIKVLLIGDGSDECTGGYMYFHNAPSADEFHKECVRLIQDIRFFDVLRADRCIAYNGLEARVPFLDHKFVDLYLSIDPELRVPRVEESLDKSDIKVESTKRKIEKWLLRKSFDVPVSDNDKNKHTWLPGEVLWRKKEAFSDGVSSKEKSWYQIIQENVESMYTDEDFEKKEYQEPANIKPYTKEALHYRTIFNELFSTESANVVPYFWLPKWSGNVKDPSARVLSVYDSK